MLLSWVLNTNFLQLYVIPQHPRLHHTMASQEHCKGLHRVPPARAGPGLLPGWERSLSLGEADCDLPAAVPASARLCVHAG